MDDLIKLVPLFTAALFFIVALKIQFLGRLFKIPLSNFLNISNLLTNTFDVINGMLYFVAPIILFLILKESIIEAINGCAWFISTGIVLICGIIIAYRFYWKDMTFKQNMILKYLAEIGLFSAGILWHNSLGSAHFDLVKLSLGVAFIFMYLKIGVKYEVYATVGSGHPMEVRVSFKDLKEPKTFFGFATNTVEYIFIKDTATSTITIIPASQIQYMSFQPILPAVTGSKSAFQAQHENKISSPDSSQTQSPASPLH